MDKSTIESSRFVCILASHSLFCNHWSHDFFSFKSLCYYWEKRNLLV